MGLTEEEFISDLQRNLMDNTQQNPFVNSAAAGLNLVLQSFTTQPKHREIPRKIKGRRKLSCSHKLKCLNPFVFAT